MIHLQEPNPEFLTKSQCSQPALRRRSPESNTQTPTLSPHAFYRAKECARMFGCSVPTWWRWKAANRICPPTKVGPGVSAWSGAYLIELRGRLIAESQG